MSAARTALPRLWLLETGTTLHGKEADRPAWNQPSITFDVSPISVHAGKKERFVYMQHPPGSFSFEYQRETDSGDWKMGDHVDCKRKL
jgi:hypothetical protein